MPARWPAAPTPAIPTDALSGFVFSQADQSLQIVGRKTFPADNQKRLAADIDDGFKVLQKVERKRVEAAGEHMRGRGANAQRVAIGRRADGTADADAAGCAGDVFDDDGLAENWAHLLGEISRQRVGCAARGKRHDHRDRTGRIRLRHGHADPSGRKHRSEQRNDPFVHRTSP